MLINQPATGRRLTTRISATHKGCTKCKKFLEFSFFYKIKGSRLGYSSACKECLIKTRKKQFDTFYGR